MKVVITIEVDETEYKEAIIAGWKERFEEELKVSDIGTLDNSDDFIWALRHFYPSSIEVKVSDD